MHLDVGACGIFRRCGRYGLPIGLQMAIVAFSNVFVQAYVNYFGTACIAGWGIYVKLDQYMMLPIQSMGQAVTTFIGQNVGAGKIQRAKNGTWVAFGIIFTVSLCVALTLNIFASALANLFSPAIVGFGYPAGWILCAIAITIYYKFVKIKIY